MPSVIFSPKYPTFRLWLNPCTEWVDAFRLCWSGENSWIFPPPTWYQGYWNTWSRVWRWEHWSSHCGLQLPGGPLSPQVAQNRLGPNSTLRGYVPVTPSGHTKCLSLKWNTMLLGSCSLVSKLLRITWLGSTNVSHAQTQSFKRTICYSLLWARSHVFEGLMCCGMCCSLHKGRPVGPERGLCHSPTWPIIVGVCKTLMC